MKIKLLCTNTTEFAGCCDEDDFAINEGDVVNALIDRYGVRFEYKPKCYSLHYHFADIEDDFISAFDEETYNERYKKASNCMAYFNDGTNLELGDVTIKT